MGKIIFITGGARSGKSSFAEQYCTERSKNLGYIATAEALDNEMKDRIKKHQVQRGNIWETYECPLDIENSVESILNSHEYVLLDCITMYISNMMFRNNLDFENISVEATNDIESAINTSMLAILEKVKNSKGNLVLVSNEIGLGIVPDNKLSRIYRDYVGRANQNCAKHADEVYFVVSSIPLKIK